MISQPPILTTTDWGAEAPRHAFDHVRPGGIVIHHTTMPAADSATREGTAQAARAIQQAHMHGPNTGWADSGMHFLVGSGGAICEGRHETMSGILRHRTIPVGAHAGDPGGNCWVGIECDGYFEEDRTGRYAPMPDEQWAALVHLCAWLCAHIGLQSKDILAHKDFFPGTQCCGNRLYPRLPRLRQEARDAILAGDRGVFVPRKSRPPETPVARPESPVVMLGDHEIACHARVEGNVTRADLRALAEACGHEVDASLLQARGLLILRPRSEGASAPGGEH